MADASKERFIFLRADRAVPYGELMDVLEILRAGGYSKIKLVALEGVSDGATPARGTRQSKALSGHEMSDLETEQKPSRRLWILAAVGALALHVGGAALAVAHLQTDDADDSLGAEAIEVGLELTSLRREATDLPPGPDTDASVASPALAEQKAEVKETELPKDMPTETDDPDRVVTPNESKKPKEEDPKIAAVQTAASRNWLPRKRRQRQAPMRFRKGHGRLRPRWAPARRQRRVRATWQKELIAPSRQAQALSGEALAEERRDRRQLRARPDGPCALGQHRQGIGRCGLRRGRAGDGPTIRSGAAAPAADRRRRIEFYLPVIFRVKGRS